MSSDEENSLKQSSISPFYKKKFSSSQRSILQIEKRKLAHPLFSSESEDTEAELSPLPLDLSTIENRELRFPIASSESDEECSLLAEKENQNFTNSPPAEIFASTPLKEQNKCSSTQVLPEICEEEEEYLSDCSTVISYENEESTIIRDASLSPKRRLFVEEPENAVQSPPKKIKTEDETLNETNDITLTQNEEENKEDVPAITSITSVNETVVETEENFENSTKHVALMTKIIEHVFSSKARKALLLDEELQLLNAFLELEFYQQLFVFKLFTYVQKRYNVFKFCDKCKISKKLNSTEILKLVKVVEDLKLVESDIGEDDDIKTLLENLDMAKIKHLCKIYKIKAVHLKKPDIIDKLIKNAKTQRTVFSTKSGTEILREHIKKNHEESVKLTQTMYNALYKALLLYTYTNVDYINPDVYFSDVTFVGAVYPDYVCEDFVPFSSRDSFTCYFEATLIRKQFLKFEEHKKLDNMKLLCDLAFDKLKSISDFGRADAFLPSFLRRYSAEYVYISILTTGSKWLTGNYFNIIKVWLEYLVNHYNTSSKCGFWYKQLAQIYMHNLKDYVAAANVILEALMLNFSDENVLSKIQTHELMVRGRMILKSKKYGIDEDLAVSLEGLVSPIDLVDEIPFVVVDAKALQNTQTGRKRAYFIQDQEGNKSYMNVEQIAIEFYHEKNYPCGSHCEGGFLRALFCLIFWDIIYDHPIEKTFLTKVQSCPLDMFSKQFYLNRKDAIDQRLNDIEYNWNDIKLDWDNCCDLMSLVKVSSSVQSKELLLEMVGCIDKAILSKIMYRFVKNYYEHRSGMPDLFLWNNKTKQSMFVEVKGENDKLSIKQTLWLAYLKDIGAHVEVCNVHTIGSKRKKKLTVLENIMIV